MSARIRNKTDSVSKKPDLDNPLQKKSKKSRAYDFDSGIQLHESSGKEDSTSTKHIPGAGAYKKRRVQMKAKKITEVEFMEEMRKENEFLVLSDENYLPRYKYHRSLLQLFIEGLPQNQVFQDCFIIIGGDFNEESKLQVFGDAKLEKVPVKNLPKETDAEINTEILLVYYFTGDVVRMHQEIMKLRTHHMFDTGIILFVTKSDISNNEPLRTNLIKEVNKYGIEKVEFVIETRSEMISKLTCVLEKRLSKYLKQIQEKLIRYSQPTENAGSSLCEVNAILRRLKQAELYRENLTKNDEDNESDHLEINRILKSFSESLLYHELDGNILNVVATDQGVKEGIEAGLLEAGFENVHLVITVQDHLSVSELSKTGEPLHGAKFVYVNEGVDAFHANECFATTGSLMFASTNNRMVAVTCRHALEQVDTCYTLIDNEVVKLGKEMPQPNNNMEKLHDDIAVVLIDEKTRSIIYEKCEKLLIDDFGHPSPAKVSLQDLKVGDIVHKRGATTGLTTGTVKRVETTIHDKKFVSPSTVIYIAGWNSKPFAEKGDSGSLVFRHSLSLEKDSLNVVAMVQARTTIPNVGDRIICFPMNKGRETLIQNIPNLQDLQFYDR